MKKKLNVDAMINELKGNSPFFPDYQKKEEPEAKPVKHDIEIPTNTLLTSDTKKELNEDMPTRTPVRTTERPNGSTPVRLRNITRYAFEFYQDQIEALRGFSLDEKQRGEKGSMSEMVRIAIDAYITKRRNSE